MNWTLLWIFDIARHKELIAKLIAFEHVTENEVSLKLNGGNGGRSEFGIGMLLSVKRS